MRCPSCNKFTGLEFQEPEVSDSSVENLGGGVASVTASVRIVRTTECCGDEAKEATFEMESGEIALKGIAPTFSPENVGPSLSGAEEAEASHEGHDLELTDEEVEQVEEGGGRYAKSFFGATFRATIRCSDCDQEVGSVEMTDKIAASQMEDML